MEAELILVFTHVSVNTLSLKRAEDVIVAIGRVEIVVQGGEARAVIAFFGLGGFERGTGGIDSFRLYAGGVWGWGKDAILDENLAEVVELVMNPDFNALREVGFDIVDYPEL